VEPSPIGIYGHLPILRLTRSAAAAFVVFELWVEVLGLVAFLLGENRGQDKNED